MKFQVKAITMHDGEVRELAALGLDIETKKGEQTKTEFTVELTEAQAAGLKAHPAVISVTAI